ncbi:target of Myb1 membrane trafficking protein-like [Gadus macrocephalus]|uniref:target of Myb1 membrane trafficking protein-like n=1 Tax=Gadus macrocephalus TaxID=80720 RepID=UPI0028CB7D15|nr:target of Myb1 membrane trafficking protein-like [Gadus macrocephalus]
MFSLGDTMEYLLGSPFSTPVGQRIERATSAVLRSEDWGLNMEICDIINETDDGPRDAVKAIKKRVVANNNFQEVMLTLTVLEACVKNCGRRFHALIAAQDFIEGVLVRAILPKHNPPTALTDRVLSLIQSWADAFRSSPSLSGVVLVYEDLRRRGLEFPMTDLDALSPIHTPSRSIPENVSPETPLVVEPPRRSEQQAYVPALNAPPPPEMSERPVHLSAEQEQKLRGEVSLVKGNLRVMSEMLNELSPGHAQPDDTELIQQLYTVCKSMQTRVVELIPRLLDEELIAELLVINDELNNAFIRYERFERLHKQQSTGQQNPPSALSPIDLSPVAPAPGQSTPATATTGQSAASSQANHSAVANHSAEEFDMFAQTRGCSLAEQRKSVRYEDPGAVEGLAGALDTRLQVTGVMPAKQNPPMSEVDRWLSADMQDQAAVSEGVTSEEFDKFLEERGRESVEPSRPLQPSTSRLPTQPAQQQEMSHDQLFSL